jgi:uncharacterized protein
MWLALVFLVLFAVRSKLRELQFRNQPRRGPQDGGMAGAAPGPAQAAPRSSGEVETMLCCAHCGVYYPASETVQLNGLDYCSPAHAGLPPR